MKHWVSGLWGTGLALLVSSAAAANAPLTVTHSEPVALAEPKLILGRVEDAAIAASGSGYLVVYPGFNYSIFGRLLDADGVPVGQPFVINAEAEDGFDCSVAFDGERFVVAWQEYLDGEAQLWVQRVSTAGTNVGELERELVGEAQTVGGLELARVGDEVVAMHCTADYDAENVCRTWLVSEQRMVLADELADAGQVYSLSLAASQGELLAAIRMWSGALTLLRVRKDGTWGEAQSLTSPASSGTPALVGTEDGWALLWRDNDDTRLTTVNFEGTLTTAVAPLIAGNVPGLERAFAVSNGFLVATNEYVADCGFCPDRQLLRQFSPTWELISEPILADRLLMAAAPSASGTRIATLWQEGWGVAAQSHASENFVLTDKLEPVTEIPSWQSGSRSAPGPDGWLVAWFEYPRVRAQLLDENGSPRGQTIELGSGEDFSIRVSAVSGQPKGWLVAWGSDNDNGYHLSVLDPSGALQHDITSLYGHNLRAVPAENGWTLAVHNYSPNGLPAVATHELGLDGSLSEPLLWAQSPNNGVSQAFDLTPTDQGYRIWWTADGTLHAKDVVANVGQDVALPAFNITKPLSLSAAQGSDGPAVTWRTEDAWYVATGDSLTPFEGYDRVPTQISAIGNTSLVGWTYYPPGSYYGPTELHSPHDDLAELPFDSVNDTREASLSVARGNRALLTFSREQPYFGAIADRVFATVVTLADATAGGAAGAGGEAGNQGNGGNDNGGAPANGGAGTEAGVPGEGGRSSGGADNGTGAGGETAVGGGSDLRGGAPRTSQSCGCRTVGHSRQHDGLYLLLLVASLAARRRRMPRRLNSKWPLRVA